MSNFILNKDILYNIKLSILDLEEKTDVLSDDAIVRNGCGWCGTDCDNTCEGNHDDDSSVK